MPQIRLDQTISLLLLIGFLLFLPLEKKSQAKFSLPPLPDYPELITNIIVPTKINQSQPNIKAKAALVIDVESAAILAEKNPDLPLPPASTTKLMTALVALDTYQLNHEFTVFKEAYTVGQTMNLQVSEKINLANLLRGLLIASANDAAFVLANNHPQGYQGFVTAMNQKSKQIGLLNSHFQNPSGLDEANHFMSVRDLGVLARVVMRNKVLKNLVNQEKAVAKNIDGSITHQLTNTNQLIGKVPGIQGIKTGYTPEAGESLVTQTTRDGHTIITVVLGSSDRFGETRNLIEWAFANHEWKTINSNRILL